MTQTLDGSDAAPTRRSRHRRWPTAVAVAALVLGGAGCGGDDNEDTPSVPGAETTTAPPPQDTAAPSADNTEPAAGGDRDNDEQINPEQGSDPAAPDTTS